MMHPIIFKRFFNRYLSCVCDKAGLLAYRTVRSGNRESGPDSMLSITKKR